METIKQFINSLFSSIKKFLKKMAKVFIYIDPKRGEDKTRGTKDKDACDEELSLTLSFEDGSKYLKSKTFPTNIITKFEYDSTCVGNNDNPVRFQITKDNGESITYTTIAWDASWNLTEKRVRLAYGTRITPDLTGYNGKVHIMVELDKKEGSSTNKVYSNEIIWEKEQEPEVEKPKLLKGSICVFDGENLMDCRENDHHRQVCLSCNASREFSLSYNISFQFNKIEKEQLKELILYKDRNEFRKITDFSALEIYNNTISIVDTFITNELIFTNVIKAKLVLKDGTIFETLERSISRSIYSQNFKSIDLKFHKLDKSLLVSQDADVPFRYSLNTNLFTPFMVEAAPCNPSFEITGELIKDGATIHNDNYGTFSFNELGRLFQTTSLVYMTPSMIEEHYNRGSHSFDNKIILSDNIYSLHKFGSGKYKYKLKFVEKESGSRCETIVESDEITIGSTPQQSPNPVYGFSFYASRIDNRGSYGTNKAYYDEEESKIKEGNTVNSICYVARKKFKYGVSLGIINKTENPTISDTDVFKILVYRKGKEYNNGDRSIWTAVSDRTHTITKQELIDNKVFYTEEVISDNGNQASLENEEFKFEVYKNDVLLNDYYYSTKANENVTNKELSELVKATSTSPEYRFKLAYYKSSIEFEDLTLFITKAHASNYGDQEKFGNYNLNIDYVAKMTNGAECFGHNKEFIYTLNFNVERVTIMEGSEGAFSPYLENAIPEINVTVYGNQDSRNHNNVGNPQENPLTLEKGFIYRVKVIAKLIANSDSNYISESIINGVLQEKTFYTTTVTLPEINSI